MKIHIEYKNTEEALSKCLKKLPVNDVLEEIKLPQFSFFINTRQESIGGITNG